MTRRSRCQAARRPRARGVSLVELMVGMVISMFVVASAFGAYLVQSRETRDLVAENKLSHAVSSASLVVASELRRIGYISPDAAGGNPFNEVLIDSGCVLYGYDRFDGAGNETPDGVVQDQERSGFRLVDGELQVRTFGSAMGSCTDAGDEWVAMTDAQEAVITNFTVALQARCLNATQQVVQEGGCADLLPTALSGDILIESREFTVTLAAERPGGGAQKTIVKTVKQRNEPVFRKA